MKITRYQDLDLMNTRTQSLSMDLSKSLAMDLDPD
jgi:hypothetical protein